MAQCTAPRNGHRTASGRDNCPACGGRGRGYRSSYSPSSYSGYNSSSRMSSGGGGSSAGRSKPRWSGAGSSLTYTDAEVRALTPVRAVIETQTPPPDPRDVFLCHAWDDRAGAAKELHDLLEAKNVSVWFSEKDVALGTSLMREIDKGLARSRIGVVLVTPMFLDRLRGEGVADKELSALLSTDKLIPIVHNTTFEALVNVSPLLAARSGMSTREGSMSNIAAKLAELITL